MAGLISAAEMMLKAHRFAVKRLNCMDRFFHSLPNYCSWLVPNMCCSIKQEPQSASVSQTIPEDLVTRKLTQSARLALFYMLVRLVAASAAVCSAAATEDRWVLGRLVLFGRFQVSIS